MSRLLPKVTINKIKSLRRKGWSLPEIKKVVKAGYGSIFRHVHGVEILPEYRSIWFGKRGGSIKRKKLAEIEAQHKAQRLIANLTNREKIIFFSALYWGEGSKGSFGLSNTDPELISVLVKSLKKLFRISQEDLRVSIRIYEDLDRNKCLQFWSKITGTSVNDFVSVNVLKGKKKGKLLYGMCRIRVRKGGNLLKYITAIKNEVVRSIKSP